MRHARPGLSSPATLIAGLSMLACTSTTTQPESSPSPPTASAVASSVSPDRSTTAPTARATSAAASPDSTAVAPSAGASAAGFALDLIRPDSLTICSAFPRTRFAEHDASGKPFGVDIDIALAIAGQLGLEPVVSSVPFPELIDAIVNAECDVAVSGHYITQQRLEQIDLIPYRQGSVSVIVHSGNPLAIDELTDLCGRTVAIVTGTVYADVVRGAGDYAGRGIDAQCEDEGLPAVGLSEHATEPAAVAYFGAGDADAYIGNEAVTLERPTEFELSKAALPNLRNGIGHRKGAAALDAALRTALRVLIDDGTYIAILERYGAAAGALTGLP